jgi:hypothetical protein
MMMITSGVHAQTGGQRSFEFLNTSGSARMQALGGVNVSLADQDPVFFMSNPALVSDSLAGWASAGYQFYVADIGQSTFAYVHPFEKIGAVNFGVQHMGYGTIKGYDNTGAETGTFRSSETALYIGKSHQVGYYRFGVNVKAAFSSIAGYRASALMIDMGGMFVHPNKRWTVAMSVRHLGFRLTDYTPSSESKIPWDVQVGTTLKPEHMPFRFSITAHNLVQIGKTYDDPASEDDDAGSLDKVLRHFNFGAELLLHPRVQVMVSYNLQRRQELLLSGAGGGAGISAGVACKIRSWDVVISRSGYTAGQGAWAFSLATNLKTMFKRKEL